MQNYPGGNKEQHTSISEDVLALSYFHFRDKRSVLSHLFVMSEDFFIHVFLAILIKKFIQKL